MTLFISETASFIYDLEQDRLNLLFHDKDKNQMIAVMTRHLFKGLLEQLPQWFIEQNQDGESEEHRQALTQFRYQSAQKEVNLTKETVSIKSDISSYLISSINLSKDIESQQVTLLFIDKTNKQKVNLSLSEAQLHKVLATMLEVVPSWDLENPWEKEAQLNYLH